MAELIGLEELPKWAPGEITLASDALGWRDVAIRAYHYGPSDIAVPGLRDFMLVSYREGSTSMDRRVDGPWSRELIVPGNVSLLTRAEHSCWQWKSDIDVTHLYLSGRMMGRVSAEMFDRDVADVRLEDVLKIDDPVLTRGIAAIAQEAHDRDLGGNLFVEAVATQVCVQILRRYSNVRFREFRGGGGLSPRAARTVADYIEAHLERPLSLGELAAVVHLSSSHFLRLFKARFGCAPHGYVVQRRLARARDLLGRPALALKEIAAHSGFSDQAHMTRLFQRHFGITPTAYRRTAAGCPR